MRSNIVSLESGSSYNNFETLQDLVLCKRDYSKQEILEMLVDDERKRVSKMNFESARFIYTTIIPTAGVPSYTYNFKVNN